MADLCPQAAAPRSPYALWNPMAGFWRAAHARRGQCACAGRRHARRGRGCGKRRDTALGFATWHGAKTPTGNKSEFSSTQNPSLRKLSLWFWFCLLFWTSSRHLTSICTVERCRIFVSCFKLYRLKKTPTTHKLSKTIIIPASWKLSGRIMDLLWRSSRLMLLVEWPSPTR